MIFRFFVSFLFLVAFTSTAAAQATAVVSTLLAAPAGIKSVAEYLKIIESLESKVDRIVDADLKTAISLFEQAKNHPDGAARLISQSRVYYTRAVALYSDATDEASRNKHAVSLLGLWTCCQAEGDPVNAKMALEKICGISTTPSWSLKYKVKLMKEAAGDVADVFRFGIVNPFRQSIFVRAIVSGNPTTEELRAADKNFDSLIAIQADVKKKLETLKK